MSSYDTKLNENKYKIAKCKYCGNMPIFRTKYTEYSKNSYLGCYNENCKNNLEIPLRENVQETIKVWNALNCDKLNYVPNSKINYIAINCCGTCQLKLKCLNGKALSLEESYHYFCTDYI